MAFGICICVYIGANTHTHIHMHCFWGWIHFHGFRFVIIFGITFSISHFIIMTERSLSEVTMRLYIACCLRYMKLSWYANLKLIHATYIYRAHNIQKIDTWRWLKTFSIVVVLYIYIGASSDRSSRYSQRYTSELRYATGKGMYNNISTKRMCTRLAHCFYLNIRLSDVVYVYC